MHPYHLNNHNLPSNSPSAIPDGLETRVLRAIHKEQQRKLVRWRWIRFISIMGLALTVVSSLGFMTYKLGQTGTSALLETIILNRDVLSLQDSLFGLLESLPLGSITVTLIAMATLCFFRPFTYEFS